MSDIYQNLMLRMMVPDSARLRRIWSLLVDPQDAELLLAMPATAADLATHTGRSEAEVTQRLEELFHRGVAFRKVKPDGVVYRGPKHLIQLHDASVQWPEAPPVFHETWKEFMNEEYPTLLAALASAGFPSFMRVVPTLGIGDGIALHPAEDLRTLIDQATDLAVCRCPCRLAEGNCEAPLETCVQLNAGARYAVERGTGRPISRDEALGILQEAQKVGLLQMVENRPGRGTVLCNCCTCCCAIIKPYRTVAECRPILAPSRYQARVNPDLCAADEICVARCPVDAIGLEEGAEAVNVREEICLGCGLCVTECPTEALTLEPIRDVEFIPQ